MRLTSKGQVTIPIEIRERLGLLPGTAVEFRVTRNAVEIRRAEAQDRGGKMVAAMRGRASSAMSTDEIMALTRDA